MLFCTDVKEMIRSAGHIIVSAILLVTVTGMTIHAHYCNDHLYDLALNAPAHSCCDPGTNEGHCHHEHPADGPSHCDDRAVHIQNESDLLVTGFTSVPENFQAIDLLFSYRPVNSELTGTGNDMLPEYRRKKLPHPREVDLPSIQVFII